MCVRAAVRLGEGEWAVAHLPVGPSGQLPTCLDLVQVGIGGQWADEATLQAWHLMAFKDNTAKMNAVNRRCFAALKFNIAALCLLLGDKVASFCFGLARSGGRAGHSAEAGRWLRSNLLSL